MKDTRINLRINEETKSKLDVIAQKEDKTVSDVIRGMINAEIDSITDIDFDKRMLDQKIEKVKLMIDDLDNNSAKCIIVFDSTKEQSLSIEFDSYQLLKTARKDYNNIEKEYIELILSKSNIVVGKCTITAHSEILAWKSFNALSINY